MIFSRFEAYETREINRLCLMSAMCVQFVKRKFEFTSLNQILEFIFI